MATIGNWLKAERRQSQPVRPIRTHFFEPLERRLLLSADWTGRAPLTSLAAPPADQAAVVILDQPQASADPAASDAVVGTTSLEVTPLATTIYWDGGGDGTSWQDPLNWSGNVVPGATNDVVINLSASNPTIRFTASAGARTVRSIRCNEIFALSGGSLTVSGGTSQFTANFSMTGGSLTATGIGTTLTTSTVAGRVITLTGGTVTATAGAIITFPTVTSLTDVNLYASGGGKIYFPKATSYVDGGYGQTIQASGTDSRIELTRLITLNGGDTTSTQVTALTGGTVVLAGNILPGVTLTASGANALINLVNAPGVTTPQWTLTDVNLTASNGGRIQGASVKSYVDNGYGQTIQASGVSSRIELPGLTTLKGGDTTNTQVTSLTSGTVVLAGRISGRATLTASGGALDLSRVTALTNSSTTNITINASNGSTVSLPAAVTTLTDVNLYASSTGKIQGLYVKSYVDNGYGQTIQASGAGSRIELPGLTLLNGGDTTSTQVTALTGGTVVLAGNISPGVTLTASGASALINLVNPSGVTTPQWTLTDVNLTASNGGVLLLMAKRYVDNGYGQTIQASGAGSRIDLGRLTEFKGGDITNTQVTALNAGVIVLSGTVSGRVTFTQSGGGTVIRGPSAPEVSTFGNFIAISDGDTTPSTTDGTNFGSVARGRTPISRTFTVRNDSLVTLTLGMVTLPTGFTLVEGLSGSLAQGASDTFTVRLDTAVAGTKSGDIRFSNNDANGGDGVENPFNFRITGIVTV